MQFFFFFAYISLCVCAQSLSHVRLFTTPWTVTRQSPLSMGFSRQEYWNGLLCPPPGDLPNPGIEPVFCIDRQVLYHCLLSTTWEAQILCFYTLKKRKKEDFGLRGTQCFESCLCLSWLYNFGQCVCLGLCFAWVKKVSSFISSSCKHRRLTQFLATHR